MIFAAKENNEVSYTKNESANAMTEYVQESLSETILAELLVLMQCSGYIYIYAVQLIADT